MGTLLKMISSGKTAARPWKFGKVWEKLRSVSYKLFLFLSKPLSYHRNPVRAWGNENKELDGPSFRGSSGHSPLMKWNIVKFPLPCIKIRYLNQVFLVLLLKGFQEDLHHGTNPLCDNSSEKVKTCTLKGPQKRAWRAVDGIISDPKSTAVCSACRFLFLSKLRLSIATESSSSYSLPEESLNYCNGFESKAPPEGGIR